LPKKGKENFRMLVADCLSTKDEQGEGAFTLEMVRKFSHRARTYVLAFFHIEHEQKNNISEEGFHEINIECIKRKFKTHRSAIDFDDSMKLKVGDKIANMSILKSKVESSMVRVIFN
jgi:hypothetical protein